MWLLLTLACTFVTDEEWAARTPDCEIEGFFLDLDGDTYGNQPARTCEEAAEGVARSGDCNDANEAINPGVDEVYYDDLDGNCDGLNDNDADGDGYPSSDHGGTDCYDAATDEVPILAGDCGVPTYTPDPGAVHPGATDTPYDAVDSDCSGGSDYDADRDGYSTCIGDCDDADPERFPDGSVDEVWYDGVDQDCDNNDGDQDGDGYYVAGYTGEIPEFFLGGDCDDLDEEVYPGAAEQWYDGEDADCAGDDDWDQDGDGYRSASEPDLDGLFGDDCDDTDATLNPGIPEDCFTAGDDNCDGDDNDVDADGCVVWYRDADMDGRGDAAHSQCACVGAGEYTSSDTSDCDDGDASVGTYTWYLDGDGDGAGTTSSTEACATPVGYAATNDDCDDADGTRYPTATEACDDADSDCDGDKNDPDVLASCVTTWYSDHDGDGYAGDDGACLCAAESPYLFTAAEDCDDADALVSPAASEVCNDALDDDCDDLPGVCSFSGSWSTGDATTSWTGGSAGDHAGSALGVGGDMDGDGLDELLVGVPGYSGSSATGLVSVVRPDNDAGSALDGATFAIAAATPSASFGAVFAAVQDRSGDGVPDLCVGAPEPGGYGEVSCFAPIGSGFVSASSADLVVTTYSSGVDFGSAVASLGDTDGDGFSELLMSAKSLDGVGVVYVVPGGSTGTRFVQDVDTAWLYGDRSGAEFGASVVTGDLNTDGVDDAVVGAPRLTDWLSAQGGAFVFQGAVTSSRTAASADLAVFGSATSQAIGAVPAAIADLNDDGANDLVLTSSADEGGVWVIAGSLTGFGFDVSSVATTRINAGSSTSFGASVAAGDLDGDGAAELVVGAPAYASAGAAFVFAGPVASGTLGLGSAAATFEPTAGSTTFGSAVVVLGDTDGDGFGDLAVGASDDDAAGSDAGAVYLFRGGGY
ncbi:hypothetical protein LBMAG42_37900 [Deltaproteobacteria bacterium]|nr:hypothetical protein LBMAG42_37900 [Deltaproteobacteria bacterium]